MAAKKIELYWNQSEPGALKETDLYSYIQSPSIANIPLLLFGHTEYTTSSVAEHGVYIAKGLRLLWGLIKLLPINETIDKGSSSEVYLLRETDP